MFSTIKEFLQITEANKFYLYEAFHLSGGEFSVCCRVRVWSLEARKINLLAFSNSWVEFPFSPRKVTVGIYLSLSRYLARADCYMYLVASSTLQLGVKKERRKITRVNLGRASTPHNNGVLLTSKWKLYIIYINYSIYLIFYIQIFYILIF